MVIFFLQLSLMFLFKRKCLFAEMLRENNLVESRKGMIQIDCFENGKNCKKEINAKNGSNVLDLDENGMYSLILIYENTDGNTKETNKPIITETKDENKKEDEINIDTKNAEKEKKATETVTFIKPLEEIVGGTITKNKKINSGLTVSDGNDSKSINNQNTIIFHGNHDKESKKENPRIFQDKDNEINSEQQEFKSSNKISNSNTSPIGTPNQPSGPSSNSGSPLSLSSNPTSSSPSSSPSSPTSSSPSSPSPSPTSSSPSPTSSSPSSSPSSPTSSSPSSPSPSPTSSPTSSSPSSPSPSPTSSPSPSPSPSPTSSPSPSPSPSASPSPSSSPSPSPTPSPASSPSSVSNPNKSNEEKQNNEQNNSSQSSSDSQQNKPTDLGSASKPSEKSNSTKQTESKNSDKSNKPSDQTKPPEDKKTDKSQNSAISEEKSKSNSKEGSSSKDSGDSGGSVVNPEDIKKALSKNGYKPNDEYFLPLIKNVNGKFKDKSMAAQFIAQTAFETGGFSMIEEEKCKKDGCPNEYVTENDKGPAGKTYQGRSYIQLTWIANYREASKATFNDESLVNDPDILIKDMDKGFEASYWFWKNRVENQSNVGPDHFGYSTKAINGKIECTGNNVDKSKNRYTLYKDIAEAMKLEKIADEKGCYS